jgi:hypothetical protein
VIIEIDKLKAKEVELNERFNELSEIIPLAILTGKLEEVKEHLEIQEKNELSQNSSKENADKIENFIELLFNKPPEPDNSTMSLKNCPSFTNITSHSFIFIAFSGVCNISSNEKPMIQGIICLSCVESMVSE